MKIFVLIVISLFFFIVLKANDGAFYAKGNQLIPINESDIAVRKEILTLKKVNNQRIEVKVYYEFYNPKDSKIITVGFEAFAPDGDVDGAPQKGNHPYIYDFNVVVNSEKLSYDVAYVKDSLYALNGIVSSLDLNKFEGSKSGNNIDFYYVYHFQAEFKEGINVIEHTYSYDLSGSVDYRFEFEYILTAANRWANKQIDDFTLIIDAGDFEEFIVDKSFFKENDEWTIDGIGKVYDQEASEYLNPLGGTKFVLKNGKVIFHKKDFKINGDLRVYLTVSLGIEIAEYLPFSYYEDVYTPLPKNELEKTILINLPFARRGYIFEDKSLQEYFSAHYWYMPDSSYIPNVRLLTKREKKWLKRMMKIDFGT